MDPEERKIAALIAAFDTEHERVKGAITALNQTGAQLKRDVTGAAAGAVTAALAELNQDIQNAGRTLKQLQRFSLWQTSLRHLMVAIAAIAVTLIAVWWYVPTVVQMTALRAERAQLEASIEDLNSRGARIELNTCGPAKRLCVLVDNIAGQFGDPRREKVYMIAKGY
jgi:hypothetical protein